MSSTPWPRTPQFVARVTEAAADLERYLTEPRWYQQLHGTDGGDLPASIAYFSPEFGIAAVLPQYSGGLGILAGDHLKSASDLAVPIIGVGLLYQYGYFKQSLSREGWQLESYPVLDPNALPLSLLREADGSPCILEVGLPGRSGAVRPRLEGAGRQGAPAAPRLERRGQ